MGVGGELGAAFASVTTIHEIGFPFWPARWPGYERETRLNRVTLTSTSDRVYTAARQECPNSWRQYVSYDLRGARISP